MKVDGEELRGISAWRSGTREPFIEFPMARPLGVFHLYTRVLTYWPKGHARAN